MPGAGILFTGRVLPPPASEHPNLAHACEEFTSAEADALAPQLEGLPMCLEHHDGTDGKPMLAVGKVLKSWRDKDGSLMIMGSIDGKDVASDAVRAAVRTRLLSGLSLQHTYECYWGGGGNGKLMLVKKPVEVSVCSQGARDTDTSKTEIMDRAITVLASYNPDAGSNTNRVRYVGRVTASLMSEPAETAPVADVTMTDATVADGASATPSAPVQKGQQRDASGRFAAPAPAVAEKDTAAPVAGAMDFSAMSKTEMADVLLKLVATNKEEKTAAAAAAEEAKKAADAREARLQELETKEQAAAKLKEEAENKEVATRLQELKDAGFGEAGLSDGLQRLSATDAATALKLMQGIVSCSAAQAKARADAEAAQRTLAAEVERQHLMEATNAYHSMLTGKRAASALTVPEPKRQESGVAGVPAVPAGVPAVQAPAAASGGGVTTVVEQMAAMPPCATYFDGMAMLKTATAGRVKASALGSGPVAVAKMAHPDATPTLTDRGHYGVEQWSGALWQQVLDQTVSMGAVWAKSVSTLQNAERRV